MLYKGQILEVCTFHPIMELGSSKPSEPVKQPNNKGRSPQLFNCHVRVCVRNKTTLKEETMQFKVCVFPTPTSELNLRQQTPQELGFLFSGEESLKPGPIRALWT